MDSGDAPEAVAVEFPVSGRVDFDGDELVEYLNPGSSVFFSLQTSADLESVSGSDGKI